MLAINAPIDTFGYFWYNVLEVIAVEIQTETKTIRWIEFDGIKFYPDKKGYWLGRRKDTKKPVRLHTYVWEYHNGPVPHGYHVHHKDHNPDNNEIENLELIEKFAHLSYHSNLQDKAWARRNMLENAVPAAKLWHKSPEGRLWHSENARKTLTAKLETTVKKTCQCCGKEYEVPQFAAKGSRFCSLNCKAQWRRDSGVDNIEYPCEMCGTPIWTNKYAKKRFCSDECRAKHNRQRWDRILEERRNAKNVVGGS